MLQFLFKCTHIINFVLLFNIRKAIAKGLHWTLRKRLVIILLFVRNAWSEDTLAYVFGIILHLNHWIFFVIIGLNLLGFIVIGKSLFQFGAQYCCEGAV